MSFDNLGLSPKVLASVEASGYVIPTPIQAQAIPHVLQGRDVLGIAQTGTGKTASFVLPMLTILEKGRARARMPRTLILEPTRELAAQVEESFNRYGVNHRLSVALLIGGVSFEDQQRKVDRGVDVLIATPGRLLDHFGRGTILLNGVEILVIDEADRMLDMGFIPDIERIAKLLPFTRQTLFFSATMPPEIQRLADNFLSNPMRIEASRPATAAVTVTQLQVEAGREPTDKRAVLRALIRSAADFKNAIIFCNRKRDVAIVHRSLVRHGFNAGALHGDMDQHARMATLDDFKKDKLTLLVASDVAARGLDIPAVSHIFNFDVPTHSEDYVHRIGRTGRAGRSGTAITIVTPADRKYVASIERLTGQPIASMTVDAGAERAASFYPGHDKANGEGRGDERGRSRGGRDRRPGAGHRQRHERPMTTEAPAAAASAEVAAAQQPVEAAAEAPAQRERPARPERQGHPHQAERHPHQAERHDNPRPPRREPRRDRDDDRAPPTVGLGDHVPQFLLRRTRVPTD
ncbi:MAG TPA: DEAD/DEAH box helicase [Bauldia sp.]|nr:DEAD/DEAH box helicase [Bauldia sp.]